MRQLKNISALAELSDALPGLLTESKPGSQKLLKILIDNEVVGLAIRTAEYRIAGRKVRLASVQNIRHELEEEELEAWQKLIRVLTHEIMNSVTPVNSLTNTIIRLFERNGMPRGIADLSESDLTNTLEALHSIEKRNKGLINLINNSRYALLTAGEPFIRIGAKVDGDYVVIEVMDNGCGISVKSQPGKETVFTLRFPK